MSDREPNRSEWWPSTPEDDQRTRDTVDRLLQGLQIVSAEWRYLYVNAAAAQQGRRTPRQLVGRTMAEVYPGIETTPLFRELERCMRERRAASFENLFTFPDGGSRWFELRVQPVPEGLCIYSADIHDRKLAQLALERRVAELESRSVFDHIRAAFMGR